MKRFILEDIKNMKALITEDIGGDTISLIKYKNNYIVMIKSDTLSKCSAEYTELDNASHLYNATVQYAKTKIVKDTTCVK